ncbi:MAG: GPR endopeptidase [Clostridia bacterium]|nr:GPR endopeptidase [Clostridia bacterium]
MNFRTDLALERCENLDKKSLGGVKMEVFKENNAKITRIDVLNDEGKKTVGKPIGKYVTVEVTPFARHAQFIDDSLESVSKEIRRIIPQRGSVLVAGLGNMSITPDALGPKCASMIFATRHITGELLRSTGLSGLRCVSAVATGVTGETGAEAGEIIKGVVQTLKPDVVITVDALAARNVDRLGTTIQMCDTGIVPGSGVGNSRQEISEKTIGVPVISIGVPTVVDAATLIMDCIGNENGTENVSDTAKNMMVTPREIDLMIERAAKLTSLAINCALQPDISPEDMLILTS